MSDEQNKTEQPTQHKLDEAKKQGNVPKSQELNSIVTLLVFICVTVVLIPKSTQELVTTWRRIFILASDFNLNSISSVSLFKEVVFEVAAAFLPIALVIAVFGVAINIFQSGFVLSAFPIKPNFSKLNPAKGIKKIFSKKTIFELFKALLKLLLVFASLYLFIPYSIENLAFQQVISPDDISQVWFKFFITISLVFVVISVPCVLLDFWFNRWDFKQKMKMSKKELKDEHKKREGDPEIKQKQKKIQQELLQKSASLSAVKDSDIVITNPTHIAVALQYKPETMAAPSVISMGEDEFAMKIRQRARKYNIVIIQNKALARKLNKHCKIGQPIPATCYADLVPVFRKLLGLENYV